MLSSGSQIQLTYYPTPYTECTTDPQMGFTFGKSSVYMNNKSTITPLSLRINFLWTLFGNAAYAISKWLILIILAKLTAVEVVGQYALGVAISMPIMAFSDLQLQTVMVTDVIRNFKFGDYLGLRILTTGLAILVIVCSVIIIGYDLQLVLVILFVTLDRAVVSISSIFHGLFQQHDRMDFISTSSILRSILSMTGISIMTLLTKSIAWICLGMALGSAVVLCFYDFRKGSLFAKISQAGNSGGSAATEEAITIHPSWRYDILKKLTWSAFPLGIIFAVMALNFNIP